MYRGRLTIDHVLDLSRRELTNRVGDCDIGTSAGSFLSGGNLEDTVDVDFKDDLKNSIASLHGRDRCESELSERGIVLAVDSFTLEDRELDS